MEEVSIVTGFPPPKPIGRTGRPRGSGKNCKLLKRLTPGGVESILVESFDRVKSIRSTAQQQGMKVKIRKLDDGFYGIWRVS